MNKFKPGYNPPPKGARPAPPPAPPPAPQTMDGRTDIWCAMRKAEMRIDLLERRLKAVEAHPALSVPSLPSPVSSVVGETCENCADQAECKLDMKGYPCMNHRKPVGGEVENVQEQRSCGNCIHYRPATGFRMGENCSNCIVNPINYSENYWQPAVDRRETPTKENTGGK